MVEKLKLTDLHKLVSDEFPKDEFVFSRSRAIDLALAAHMKLDTRPSASPDVERLRSAGRDLLTAVDAADTVKRGDFYHERKALRQALAAKGETHE